VRLGVPLGLMVSLALIACNVAGSGRAGPGSMGLDSTHVSALADSVRGFMTTVASDVTGRGPQAWGTHFAQEPAFFMASEGRLVFATSEAATQAIATLTRTIAHVELSWTAVRVDPLGPGLAMVATPYHERRVDRQGRRVEEDGFFTALVERRGTRWQFRDAHWSVATPPAIVP
jgi:hypothetical protein